MDHTAHIALGANLGRPDVQLEHAINLLATTHGVAVEKVSRFIETAPVGGPSNQPQ